MPTAQTGGLLAHLDLVPLGVGLLFLLVGAVGLLRTVPRLRRSLPADGVVLTAQERGDGESSGWWLTVGYQDVGGRPQQARWHGDSSTDRTRYAPGSPVPVRYDPVDPRRVWLPGGGRVHPVLVPAVLTVLGSLLVIGFGLLR